MRQHRISNWLKGLTINIGILGLFVFGALLLYELYTQKYLYVAFTIFTSVICYYILFQFWKVCFEIGNDNSISMENASSFHKMAIGSGSLSVCCFIKLLCHSFMGDLIIYSGILFLFEIVGGLILVVLCEALSKLIANAYEMKMENDLTI